MLYQITNTGATLVLVHPDLVKTATAAAAQAGLPKTRLFLFSDQYHDPINGVQDWRTMIGTKEQGDSWEWTKLSPPESLTQVATLNFSSGYIPSSSMA
jgi:4-coumarate--CoA ligase